MNPRRFAARIVRGAQRRFDLMLPARMPKSVEVVAGMATMPTRDATFPTAFESIIRQVDRLYLYLDGHDEVPRPAKDHPKVVAILARDEPGHRSNGKFLGLIDAPTDAVYISVDDDIFYGRSYVKTLLDGLQRSEEAAVVGLHASIFARPMISYRTGWTVVHFAQALQMPLVADTLGAGTTMFRVRDMRFDARRWQHTNMDDLCLAIEACSRGLQMIGIARPARTAVALASVQEDSIHKKVIADDSAQTALARELLALRAANGNLRVPQD